jgi:hypothetical protein
MITLLRLRLALALIALAGLVASCGPSANTQLSDYKATVLSGIKVLPWAKEMETLFGEGDHFITHYNFSPGPKTWNTEIFFGGRYELTLQVDVEIDYKQRLVVRTVTSPRFYLREIDSIQIAPSGHVAGSYSNDWTFDEVRWKKLVASGGDWSQIGISIKSNAVPGFDQHVKAMRAPRVQVPH